VGDGDGGHAPCPKRAPRPRVRLPDGETRLLGAAAFLNLDASLFWLVCLMLAGNVREDYFDGRDEAATGIEEK
jgi:hypothetical protein